MGTFRWCRSIHRFWQILALVALTPTCRALAEAEFDWTPPKTWVFAVGLLEWERPDLWPPFPAAKVNRRDAQLVKFFRDAGVPPAQIVYLQDSAAVKSRIDSKFSKLLESTAKGDLLVFYFCGHGFRNVQSDQTWFANFDAEDRESSAWNVRQIFMTIEKHFRGNRALMLADCCHSGALYDEAQRRAQSRIAYAAITSAYSHNSSTGAWTFTDSVLAALRGKPTADFDGNHIIGLDEIARFTALEMAFVEGQRSMFSVAGRFPRAAKMGSAPDSLEPWQASRVEAYSEGTWYKARVLETSPNAAKVHYVDYDDSWDEWLTWNRIRNYEPRQYPIGQKVKVRWKNDGKWYPATVREAWYGLHLVHYDGYGQTWDEWVGPDAIAAR